MDTRLHVLMALDGLRFGAGREEVVDAMTAVADHAFEAGRVEGRLDILVDVDPVADVNRVIAAIGETR